MASTTTNLSLRKPDYPDTVDVAIDISGNMQLIDDKWAAHTPTTQTVGDSASQGSSLVVARSDHKHAITKGTPVAVGTALTAGSAGTFADSAHIHTVGTGAINSAGMFAAGVVDETALGTGAVTSAKILDGTIVNDDVNASAGIVVSKLSAGGTANRVALTTDGTNVTWGQIVNAQVDSAAAITVSKLSAGGTANRVVLTTDGTNVTLGQIVNAQVDSAAAITVSKLAAGGTSNRVVGTTDGTTMTLLQVPAGAYAALSIAAADIANGAGTDTVLGNRTITDSTSPSADTAALTTLLSNVGYMLKSLSGKSTWRTAPDVSLATLNTGLGTITGSPTNNTVFVGTGTGTSGWSTISNSHINASADIAVTKIVKSGTNEHVLRTTGSAVSWGQITAGSYGAGTIVNADISASADIAVSKLNDGGTSHRVVGTSDGSTMSMLRITASGNSSMIGTLPAVRCYRNAGTLNIVNVTETAITFDTDSFDLDTMHDTSSNTSRLTAKTAGVYFISGGAYLAADADGVRDAYIRVNGTTRIGSSRWHDTTGVGSAIQVSAIASLALNDYVELTVYHNGGSDLAVSNGSGNTYFGMYMICQAS